MTVVSPISGKVAKYLFSIKKEDIVKKYADELSVTVNSFFNQDEVHVYCCNETGYRFYVPLHIYGDDSFYGALQKNKNYYVNWKTENAMALNHALPDDFILDVGCGQGFFLEELKNKKFKNLFGIDTSLNKIEYINNTAITFSNLPIDKYALLNKNKFDLVTCFQVLEHVSNVKEFIESCLLCLKVGGKLLIAVPNNNPFIYKHDILHTLNLPPHHAGLWDKTSLINLPKYFKMKLVSIDIEPIGEFVSKYTLVQIEYLSNNSAVFKFLFKFKLAIKLYSKYLYLKRNVIEGRNSIAVFEKLA